MKISLIQFSANPTYDETPTAILALATYIKNHGHQPSLLDQKISKPKPDFFLKTAKKILGLQPEIIGFSALCDSLPITLLVAKECKVLAPKIPIVLGGPDVTFEEISLLKSFPQIDIIIRGEGEITLCEVLDTLEKNRSLKKTQGITFREQGNVIRNSERLPIKDLDLLPFPNYSILPKHNRYRLFQVEGGRGCPFQCTFCSTSKMWGRKFRIKSPNRLIEELKTNFYQFNKNSLIPIPIPIIHDNLFANRFWAEEFLSLLSGQGIKWTCSCRLDTLNEALIKKLKGAGCQIVFIGIESASRQIRHRIKKNLNLKNLSKILRSLSENEISCILSFIIGFPGEGPKELNQTLMMALQSKLSSGLVTIQIYCLSLLKGTDLYNQQKTNLRAGELADKVFSPLLSNLPDERCLIKKYPAIFPSFHHIKSSSLNPEFLQKTSVLFVFLCEFFPATTLFLLRQLSFSPYQLAKEVVLYSEKKNIQRKSFINYKLKPFNYYFPLFRAFLKYILKTKSVKPLEKKLVMEVFFHEEIFQKVCFYGPPRPSRSKKIRTNSFPLLKNGIKIKKYNYDVFRTIDSLKTNGNKFSKKESFVVYVPGEISNAFPIDRPLYNLLALCNGKRTIMNIIKLTEQRNVALSRNGSKEIIALFKFLQEKGIIKV